LSSPNVKDLPTRPKGTRDLATIPTCCWSLLDTLFTGTFRLRWQANVQAGMPLTFCGISPFDYAPKSAWLAAAFALGNDEIAPRLAGEAPFHYEIRAHRLFYLH
jgi:hypothetical protein